jgi:hypothetical protein
MVDVELKFLSLPPFYGTMGALYTLLLHDGAVGWLESLRPPVTKNDVRPQQDNHSPGSQTRPLRLNLNNSLFQPRPSSVGVAKLHGGGRRRWKARPRFGDRQIIGLKERLEAQKYLSIPERVELASQLSLTVTQVQIWFQNRRANEKIIESHYDGLMCGSCGKTFYNPTNLRRHKLLHIGQRDAISKTDRAFSHNSSSPLSSSTYISSGFFQSVYSG